MSTTGKTSAVSLTSTSDFDRYVRACDYPGLLDAVAVEDHLQLYLQALGITREVVRLPQGWRLEDFPSLQRYTDGVIDDIAKRNPPAAQS